MESHRCWPIAPSDRRRKRPRLSRYSSPLDARRGDISPRGPGGASPRMPRARRSDRTRRPGIRRGRSGRRPPRCPAARPQRARHGAQLAIRFGPAGDDDTRRCGADRLEVVPVVGARLHVLAQQWVVARSVVLGRQAEHRRIRGGLIGPVIGERALVHDERDEARHAGAEAITKVRLVDGPGGCERGVTVGQDVGDRRLVRHQRADVLRMLGRQHQRIHGAPAAGEEVDGAAELSNEPMQVIGVLLGRRGAPRIGLGAALHARGS